MGPNPWDDYELVPTKEQPLRVAAGIEIQVEDRGARFRVRRRGQVFLAEWTPSADERAAITSAGGDIHQAFLRNCVADYASSPGVGLAAVITRKLRRRD